MIHIILFAQLVACFILAKILWLAKRIYKIEINIHNLPIIVITANLLLLAALVSATHLLWYLPTGILLAIICWFICSYKNSHIVPMSISNKIKVLSMATFFWPQLLCALAFVAINHEKIYENTES